MAFSFSPKPYLSHLPTFAFCLFTFERSAAMPIVPGDPFVPSVMPQGQMIYNTIDRATPEAFGGQVGQTLQQAGNMLAQHAVQRQQLANETNVNDVYTNQFSPAARDIYQNYMKLEGKDAEARFPEFQQQMNDLRTQTRANLPNPMQQKAFDAISTTPSRNATSTAWRAMPPLRQKHGNGIPTRP